MQIQDAAEYAVERAMKEGFDTYRVYINIDGEPLQLTRSERPWWIAPIWAK